MDAKEYYRTGKRSDWEPNTMRLELIKEIRGMRPRLVFEFGCGAGENLNILSMADIGVQGIEINQDEVDEAHRNGLSCVFQGDECSLRNYYPNTFDISFTIGVLDHIPDIQQVVNDLRMLTKRWIYCLETNDIPYKHYYPHDYEALGFYKLHSYISDGDGVKYHLWRKEC